MRLAPLIAFLLAALACRDAPKPAATSSKAVSAEPRMPDGPLGVSVRRGLALIEHTPDSLPEFVGANLRCTSCHLDRGLRANASPLVGVHDRYPRFVERTGAVVAMEERVNYCFTRSLAGRALPPRSREMVDILAYLSFLQHGPELKVEPSLAPLPSDSARGAVVYLSNCSRCHGVDGAGIAPAPAVWGARSFSIGASMSRVGRAAAFIRRNMPFDRPGTLTDQQAWDVAAYVNTHARPDLPKKELDWPAGNAPADVPYTTHGHTPAHPTPVLPRTNAEGAYVPAPTSVRSR